MMLDNVYATLPKYVLEMNYSEAKINHETGEHEEERFSQWSNRDAYYELSEP
jgi:hypothetical protein